MRARTMREAWNEGTMFEVVLKSDRRYKSCCPAAESVGDAIACAMAIGTPWESRVFVPGAVVEIERELPQSKIGCVHVERVGEYVLPAREDAPRIE